MIAQDEIRSRLLEALPGAEIDLCDVTGTSDHYEVTVVTEAFEGKTLVERHRMVYAPLRHLLGEALHALSLKTLAPGE